MVSDTFVWISRSEKGSMYSPAEDSESKYELFGGAFEEMFVEGLGLVASSSFDILELRVASGVVDDEDPKS